MYIYIYIYIHILYIYIYIYTFLPYVYVIMCYSTCVLLSYLHGKQMSTTFLTWNHFVSGLVPDVSSFFSSPAGTNGETGPGTVGYLSVVPVFHQNWFLLKPSWQLMLTIADLIPKRYFTRVIPWNGSMTPRFGLPTSSQKGTSLG